VAIASVKLEFITGPAAIAAGKIKAKTDQLAESMKKFQRISSRAWDKFGNQVRKARRRVQVGVAKMTKSLMSLKGVLAGLAIGQFVRQIFTAAATMERFEAQLKTLTGSGAKAKQIMAELQAVNKKSPFELPDLVKASAKLKAYGVETDNLVEMTERLGKISAGTRSDIGGIALAYGQALAKGKLMGEELRQFLERGVPVREELEKLTGITGDKFDEAMRKGQISSGMLTEAIKSMTNETGQFGSAFADTANSLDTKLSNMQDAFFRASAALGKAFEPVFKFILDSLTAIFDYFTKMMEGIQRNLNALGRRLEATQLANEKFKERFGTGRSGAKAMQKAGVTKGDLFDEALADLEARDAKQAAISAKMPELVNGVNQLNNVTDQVSVKWETIRETIASGLTSAVEGLIAGTKTLGESLAGIAKSIASMYLKAAFMNMLPGLPVKSAEGRYMANGIKPFASGGMATRPTVGLVGEAGEDEYIIPASKMASSMQRYSAGARGEAVIPGTGSSYAGGGAGSSTTVNYSGPILNFNSEEFVPKSAVGQIIATATSQGAKAGENRTLSTLRNSRSARSRLGM
jgi:tape measure domain-containing protein